MSALYLDYNATTPLAPGVLEAMLPWLSNRFGNPSSLHTYGREAHSAIKQAREQVANAINAHPSEVIFTSGATEANNLFIKGMAGQSPSQHLTISAIEHSSVLGPATQLGRQDWKISTVPVDSEGQVDLPAFEQLLDQSPGLISIMLANNETGALQPISQLAKASRRCGAIFHTDATQALGKIPLDFQELRQSGLHALSLSAHKIGGPKGVGALLLDKRLAPDPLISGGGHERGYRSGTENVAGIVGFGKAAELAARSAVEEADSRRHLRSKLETELKRMGAALFSAKVPRLPNTSFFAFPGMDGGTLVGKLDRLGFAVASGAACSSGQGVSPVLQAMGVPLELAQGAIRVSLGQEHTDQEIKRFLEALEGLLKQLNGLKSLTF